MFSLRLFFDTFACFIVDFFFCQSRNTIGCDKPIRFIHKCIETRKFYLIIKKNTESLLYSLISRVK